ncbi:polysaccharide deacetylase family protein [Desulfobulbus sp.]|uniref:polysaccharide deacetylase family protein n=1 Tax=Desulfobulbus sp. TaxID=895 RepID=UPI00286F8C8D|nr:polysaccharide deacetylase family protein [Desulfobulbus sp.]
MDTLSLLPAFLCMVVVAFPAVLGAAEPIPGRLPPERTPQFVGIGFDDNYSPAGVDWVVDTLMELRNPPGTGNAATFDGAPVRATFFNNTDNGQPVRPGNELGRSYVRAAASGHEIGAHTRRHDTSAATLLARWREEIGGCRQDLAALGLPLESIAGFRAPFLLTNRAAFVVLRELRFAYDCSLEHGFADRSDGTDLRWPYPLDHGSPDDPRIGPQPGLWEMPVYALTVPPRLRAAVQARLRDFDVTSGKITGMDWNMVVAPELGGAGFTAEEYLETLKYSLNQRLRGNRAPLLFGAHSQFYSNRAVEAGISPPNITLPEMRRALTQFIAYALTKPDVRIVPYRSILAWSRHPVPLGPPPAAR